MNSIEFSQQLQARVSESLQELNVEQDELIKVASGLSMIRASLQELRDFITPYKFQDEAEEIQFFKEIKPVFLSQYFYYKKVFQLRTQDSFQPAKAREANYDRMLQKLQSYTAKHLDFYEYCLTNQVSSDRQYFVRTNTMHQSIDCDTTFSTGYDIRLGRILANELLKKFLLKALQNLQSDGNTHKSKIHWTGSKTALIELVYALQAVDVFNNGTADIKLIASTLEESFNVSLGNYYRVFQDIRMRKGGQTNFLDDLKARLIQRIEEID